MSGPDPTTFRRVLGRHPTGVTVVTAVSGVPGVPVGMAVGTFTSVSLDPPLVGFFAGKDSTTWPRIRAAGAFCANVLGEDQEALCRAFASPAVDRFAGVAWSPASSGSPMLAGALAWVDCDIAQVLDTGDHELVLGRVGRLGVQDDQRGPLVFFGGQYHTIT